LGQGFDATGAFFICHNPIDCLSQCASALGGAVYLFVYIGKRTEGRGGKPKWPKAATGHVKYRQILGGIEDRQELMPLII
jgi:hypothetical protein